MERLLRAITVLHFGRAWLGLALLATVGLTACEEPIVPASSFYDEKIDPVVQFSCAQQTNGCHIASPDGEATGNLDMSSFDALMRRDDTLPAYGPYPIGLVFLKGAGNVGLTVETWDPDPTTGQRFAEIQTDVRHAAGATIDIGSPGYAELKRWIEGGASRTGVPDESTVPNQGECVRGIGHAAGFDPGTEPTDQASWDAFRSTINPLLQESCAGSQCHGNRFADLYLTCGESDAELRWNYYVTLSHVTTPASTSGLLRRPLSTLRGGTFHEGGNVLPSTDDERYQALFAWANDVAERAPQLLEDPSTDRGLRFFANRVQPVLVRKGCMFLNCHSPAMFHDLRLRGGDQGSFSRIATHRNYEMSRAMLAVEAPNPNSSRIVAKNLFPALGDVSGATGLLHRGGSLFEDLSTGDGSINLATPDDCAGVDADGGDLNEVPAYCVMVRWHEIEREEAIARGEVFPDDQPIERLVWVSRPPGVGDIRDFDTFRGGADLRHAPVTTNPDGSIELGPSASFVAGCGLSGDLDIRTPAVSWDGSRIAFAARAGASSPLRLYWMNADGSGCEPVPGAASSSEQENGIFLHDFDPAWAPDGRLVFASTRGNVEGDVDYRGPTRTPAAMQPNANLFILEDGSVRQMTFLLNQELAPAFMTDGRLIMTAEKRQPDFHQLALRRQNLDGLDYHPLYAQRGSVGVPSATEVTELANRNLAFVGAPLNTADGAGTIVVVNRSVGPDQDDRPTDDRAYLHAVSLPAPGAFAGIPGVPTGSLSRGAFRSPAALPTGRLVASCDLNASDLNAGPFMFELCEIDPATGAVRSLGGEAGQANVEAAAVYARAQVEIFESRQDEANGATRLLSDLAPRSEVHFLDFPLLATLLFENIRGPRRIDSRVGGFNVLEVRPPPAGATSFGDAGGNVVSDAFGMVYAEYTNRGFVPLYADGSAKVLLRGGAPVLLEITDSDGAVLDFVDNGLFSGPMRQREQMQFYPGERLNQSFPRRFFNGLCGTCHGSVSGRELDAAVDPDIITQASRTTAANAAPDDAF